MMAGHRFEALGLACLKNSYTLGTYRYWLLTLALRVQPTTLHQRTHYFLVWSDSADGYHVHGSIGLHKSVVVPLEMHMDALFLELNTHDFGASCIHNMQISFSVQGYLDYPVRNKL